MGGLVTRKRSTVATVAVAAALLVVGTTWVVRGGFGGASAVDLDDGGPATPPAIEPVAASDIDGVSVTMDVPTYDLGGETHGSTLEVIVDNDSGRRLSEVAVDVVITDPGGDLPPMMVAADRSSSCEEVVEDDDPDADVPDEHYVDEQCLRQQRLGDQGCVLSVTGEGDIPYARHARCVDTLDEGENRFGFETRVLSDNPAEARDYPNVTATARLSVDGEEFASAETKIKTKYPKGWDRMRFADLPAKIDSGRTASNPYRWSLTVTNDTDKALTDATAVIASTIAIGVDSDHSGCRRDPEEASAEWMRCDGIDLAAGSSLTIPMTSYFSGDVGKIKKNADCQHDMDDCLVGTVGASIGEKDEKTFAELDATATIRLAG